MADSNHNVLNSVNKSAITSSYDKLRVTSQINRDDLLYELLITHCCKRDFILFPDRSLRECAVVTGGALCLMIRR